MPACTLRLVACYFLSPRMMWISVSPRNQTRSSTGEKMSERNRTSPAPPGANIAQMIRSAMSHMVTPPSVPFPFGCGEPSMVTGHYLQRPVQPANPPSGRASPDIMTGQYSTRASRERDSVSYHFSEPSGTLFPFVPLGSRPLERYPVSYHRFGRQFMSRKQMPFQQGTPERHETKYRSSTSPRSGTKRNGVPTFLLVP